MSLTRRTQYRFQTPLSLRQPGTYYLPIFHFLRSASAKNEIQKEDEVPLREITSDLPRSSYDCMNCCIGMRNLAAPGQRTPALAARLSFDQLLAEGRTSKSRPCSVHY